MFKENYFELGFVDFTIDGGTFVTVLGILECAVLCLNTKDCFSFFYSHNMHSCSVSAIRYFNTEELTSRAGSKYYIMAGTGMQCSSRANCFYLNSTCSHASCICDVGYSYQPLTRSCFIGCKDYGDSFSAYRGLGIFSCNTKSIYVATGSACMMACRDETTFDCINAEFEELHGKCNLCNKAWFDLPEDQRDTNSPGWIFYHRQCVE